MVVRCIKRNRKDLSSNYADLGYPEIEDDVFDITIGQYYAVYAIKEDEDKFFLVNTDTTGLWWMPAELYKVTNSIKPKGWEKSQITPADLLVTYWAYPSLADWKVENGIIDNEAWAIDTYMEEINGDPTFPTEEQLLDLNKPINDKKRQEAYDEALRLARERGWEYPETE